MYNRERMDKDKRNIQQHADKEVKHLMVLLDRSQASAFKKMVPELQDNWAKKQMFRTETEMRFSVLSDSKYGSNASKYWQSVREQNTHFENLMHLSFEYRKNDVEIKKIQRDIKKEKIKMGKNYENLGMAEVGNCHPLRLPTYGINLPTPTMRRAQRNQIRRTCL